MHLEIAIYEGFNAAVTMAFVDPFRAANYLMNSRTFHWSLLSQAGGLVTASNGIAVETMSFEHSSPGAEVRVISTSWTPEAFVTKKSTRWVRSGGATCWLALDTAPFVFQGLGLAPGNGWCLHEEHHFGFKELFPKGKLSDQAWNLESGIGSAVGPVAAAELALELITRNQGAAIAQSVRQYLYLPRAQPNHAAPSSLAQRAQNIMLEHIENPISIAEICLSLGCENKALSRACKREFGFTAKQLYLTTRLEHARRLVVQTDRSMVEIALATGFPAASNFSVLYKRQFGQSPSDHRGIGRVPFELR